MTITEQTSAVNSQSRAASVGCCQGDIPLHLFSSAGALAVTDFRRSAKGNMKEETIHKLYGICEGLNNRFPGNRDPFRILARLTEECGEIASQVHHFEGIGRKPEKHGSPDKTKLAKEIQDVMTAVLSFAVHYGVEDELKQSIDKHYRMVIDEGLVTIDE